MLISVLIAAYQAGPFIATALDCLEAQEHRDWELVVIEDGSSDQTKALVEAFATRVSQSVRYLNPGVNQGVAKVRSLLLREARGEAVAFLDADDLWSPQHLSVAARLLAEGADVIVADVQAFDLVSGRDLRHYSLSETFLQNPVRTLFTSSPIVTSTAVTLRQSLCRRLGDFDAELRIGEDRDYWLRAALAGARFARGGGTCRYAKHEGSSMAKTLLVAKQTVLFHEKQLHNQALPAALRRQELAQALEILVRLTRHDDPRACLKPLLRALGQWPFRLRLYPLLALSVAGAIVRGAKRT